MTKATPEVRLYEISALVNRVVVVAATSIEEAMAHIADWEKAWEHNSDFIGVSDIEVVDVRDLQTDDADDEAHEVTASARAAITKATT